MVVGIGIFAIFASGRLNAPGAGALIAIITPLVTCKKWNEDIVRNLLQKSFCDKKN